MDNPNYKVTLSFRYGDRYVAIVDSETKGLLESKIGEHKTSCFLDEEGNTFTPFAEVDGTQHLLCISELKMVTFNQIVE